METIQKLDINIDGEKTKYSGYLKDNKYVYIELNVLEKLSGVETEVNGKSLNISTDIDWIDIPINETIIIDFGHGGKDAGAVDGVNEYDKINTLEKDLNRIIGRMVGEKLKQLGIKVIYTRKEDETLGLKDRTDMANKTDAKLFLSIHFNASSSESANGIETFKYKGTTNPLSHKFAENLQKEMIKATEFKDRGVKEASFWVLKHTKMASALIELGFITNDKEEKKIHTIEFQESISNAIVDAIVLTFNI